MTPIRWRESTWGKVKPGDLVQAPDGSEWRVLSCMCDVDAKYTYRGVGDLVRYWIESPSGRLASITRLNHETIKYYRKRQVKLPTPEQLTKREAKAREREVLKEQRRQERERARIQARLDRIAEVGGPLLELPALKNRGTAPRSVSLFTAINLLRNWPVLTVDVEHTGYQLGHNSCQLRTIQLGYGQRAVVFDADDPEQCAAAGLLLKQAPKLHAHSATADLCPLIKAGIVDESIWEKMDDTAIRARLADPALAGDDAGLKDLAPQLIGETNEVEAADAARKRLFQVGRWLTKPKPTTPFERNGWAQVDKRCAVMVNYAASDVLDTALLPGLLPESPPQVLERERVIQRMVARIAQDGLPLDREQVSRLLIEHTSLRDGLARQIIEMGVENPDADGQVAQRLVALGAQLPETDTGNPSAAEVALRKVRDDMAGYAAGSLAGLVLEHRHHSTVLGLFLEPWQEYIDNGDGRVRPTVYTLGTKSGRMSCKRPNLQQVSQSGGIRPCIIADPGHVLISADFSGVEWRIAAALSGDQAAIDLILEEDEAKRTDPDAQVGIHWEVAWGAFGPEATKKHRYTSKRIVYGTMYSGGIATLAAQAGCDEPTAEKVMRVIRNTAPTYIRWSKHVQNQVRNGYHEFKTYSGRVVHFDPEWPHRAVPQMIQATGRELLVDGMLRWRQTRWGGSIILPVHDELIVMVPEADATEALAALVGCMRTEFRGVPIVVEANQPSFAWQDAA